MSLTLFTEGKLREALASQSLHVAKHPVDAAARLFLIELHLYVGDLTEARKQLELLPLESDAMREYVGAYHQLLNAESHRQRLFIDGEITFLSDPPEHVRRSYQAIEAYRQADPERCAELWEESLSLVPEYTGHVDGREFHELRNSDDFLGNVLELLIGSDYVWLPFESIRKLRLGPIETPRDHLFRPGLLTLHDRRVLEVHVPTVYAGTAQFDEEELLLGRATDWTSDNGEMLRGIGEQLLSFDDAELTLHDFQQVEIKR